MTNASQATSEKSNPTLELPTTTKPTPAHVEWWTGNTPGHHIHSSRSPYRRSPNVAVYTQHLRPKHPHQIIINNNNWLQHPGNGVLGAVLRARRIWEQVSQALCMPYPLNPSFPVIVYRLLDIFQAITIGGVSEVASPYLVRYAFCKFASYVRYGVRYDLRILYSF